MSSTTHGWLLAVLVTGCVPAASTSTPLEVSYREVGSSDGVVVLVESRPDRGREYLVLCDATRSPPCVRVPAETLSGEDLDAWRRPAPAVASPLPVAPTAPRPPAECEGDRCGQLRLVAHPWCELEIDGTVLGHTPILDRWLPAGTYEARCHNPETGQVEVFGVRIEPSRRTTLNVGIGRL